MKPRIALTMGDPAGIGPEVCLRAMADPQVLASCVPIVFGDPQVLAGAATRLRMRAPEQIIASTAGSESWSQVATPAVLQVSSLEPSQVVPGKVSAVTGQASFDYVDRAIQAALAGEVDAIATGPIHKAAWNAAGIQFPGHTEILEERTAADRVCMMLTSPEITCSLVTSHAGLGEVPSLLSIERITDVLELTNAALVRMLGRPVQLAVCGLNPHAGEEGLFGDREEERLIMPAIESARAQGLRVVGPLSPDTAFLPGRRKETDGYICMYHDQGLIPLKTLAFDISVNVTLGLPIVRTSVDHGTALDIAWQNRADATSMTRAVELAAKLCLES